MSPRFTDEQLRVIETWDEGIAVVAGAGSGKTTTLAAKCERLLARKPEGRFLALSFTERSTADLRRKFSEFADLAFHRVATIHGFCTSVIRDFPEAAGVDVEETVLDEAQADRLWERACQEVMTLDSDLAEPVRAACVQALDRLLAELKVNDVLAALTRVRRIAGFGALERLRTSSREPDRDLARVAEFALERYGRAKQRLGALDFDDLEQRAAQALKRPEVRSYFHRRYDLVLIDEFQDTNVVQAGIVAAIARPDASNLCVVGDPKQSIYGFRDADVEVFEEFCARLPVRVELSTNFRSRPGILACVNQVCAPLFDALELPYQALTPGRNEPDLATAASMPPVTALRVETPAELARWFLARQSAGQLAVGTHALLLRKIRGNGAWLDALVQAGVELAVGSGGQFWSDPRVREVVALLKAWDNPNHALSAAVALRAPWLEVPDAWIDAHARVPARGVGLWNEFLRGKSELGSGVATRVRQRLAELDRASAGSQELSVAAVLLALVEEPAIEAELGAAVLGLWHRAETARLRGESFSDVVRRFALALEHEPHERDVPPAASAGQLAVLTLHGAKGLEFDHVVLLDFRPTAARSQTAQEAVFWDRRRGAYLPLRSRPNEDEESQQEIAAWREVLDRRRTRESARLFYVALTRARDQLTLVLPSTPPQLSAKLAAERNPSAAYSTDHWYAWVDASGVAFNDASGVALNDASGVAHSDASGVASAVALPAAATPSTDNARHSAPGVSPRWDATPTRVRHSATQWAVLAQCPARYAARVLSAGAAALQVAPDTDTKGLERGFDSEPDSAFDSGFDPGLDAVWDQALDASTLPAAETSLLGDTPELDPREVGTRVHRALELGRVDQALLGGLESRVPIERLRQWWQTSWLGARASRAWVELAFELRVGSETVVGAIDRLVVAETESAPTAYVIDYKVVARPHSAKQLWERYGVQLALYARAAAQLSGYPVQVVIVEISPHEIREHPFPAQELAGSSAILEELATLAREITGGLRVAEARPSIDCHRCEHLQHCVEGQRATERDLAPSAR